MTDPVFISLLLIGIFLLLFMISGVRWRLIQWVGKGIIHVGLGIFLLFLANVFGAMFDITLPMNEVTVLIAAVLGIPGVIGLLGVQVFVL